MTELVVVIPVLARPERVEAVLSSLQHGRGSVPYRALFVASEADTAERAELEWAGAEYLVAPWPAGPGDWARKINLAYWSSNEPWLFTGADDLCWCPGWADRALECAAATGAGVVGTNDLSGRRRPDHATHSLVSRAYIEAHGTIDDTGLVLHEGYDHQFVDNELVETASSRGLFHYCEASWVDHLHPHWRKGEMDETYRKGQAKWTEDQRLFLRRRRLWASPATR